MNSIENEHTFAPAESELKECQNNWALAPTDTPASSFFVMNLTSLHNEAIIDCSLPAEQRIR